MVLEPLSAFAIACNVLQVIEAGATVLSKASEYKATKDGMLAEHKDLRAILSSLQRLNDDLQVALPTARGAQSPDVAEQRLRESNEECLKLSKDFIALLDRLKVQNPHALTETIRMSVKTIWYRDKIKTVDKNLSRARDNLSLSLLVYMYHKQVIRTEQPAVSQQSTSRDQTIFQAVSNSSSLIRDDIKTLTQRLDGLGFESIHTVFEDFSAEHRRFLDHFSQQLDSICAMHNKVLITTMDDNTKETHRILVESLCFPQMQDRRDHLNITYHNTYRWVLSPDVITGSRWDNLLVWLSDVHPSNHIYWISSKPGAGKSSLVRFLDDQLNSHEYMEDWAEQMRVIKLTFYFWSPGHALQKSIAGFLRSTLYQLVDELPELLHECVPRRKWNMAQSGDRSDIIWTNYELREILRNAMIYMRTFAKVFLLIDGLDEIEGDDDIRDELVELLREISSYSNVKLCVSSRRWTIFQDAFAACPQMRLEDLNGPDINAFVRREFQAQYRYQQMLVYDTAAAEDLVNTVIFRAEGVFLWAKLVVKELVRGLRDGDSNRTLRQKLQSIPGDLDRYFRQILESIEPKHRKEACILLQLALHNERDFIALNPLRLIDLIFMDDAEVDFALDGDLTVYMNTFQSAEVLYYKLDSTLRRLLSRSKGLLECHCHPFSASRYVVFDADGDVNVDENENENENHEENLRWDRGIPRGIGMEQLPSTTTSLSTTLISSLRKSKYLVYNFQIDFMHRSLRDYLLQAETQDFLHRYTSGPFDARNYLRNARLMEIFMNMSINFSSGFTVGLASYFISTLSVPDFRQDSRCARFATQFQPVVEYLHHGLRSSGGGWYLCQSLQTWFREQSNFVSLAIDFALTGYLATALTAQIVHEKAGRPLLDYALRPRFTFIPGSLSSDSMKIGNQVPIPELILGLISLGADPNQMYEGVSIWPLYLSFIASSRSRWQALERVKTAHVMSLELLINAGVDLRISKSALIASLDHKADVRTGFEMDYEEFYNTDDRFLYCWPGLSCESYTSTSVELGFSVLDMLDCFKPLFGNDTERLKEFVRQRVENDANKEHETHGIRLL